MNIIVHPHESLTLVAADVTEFHSGLASLVEQMTCLMIASKGIGLAAPQVVVAQRVVIVDPTGSGSARAFVNPQIDFASPEKVLSAEGCLSLPGIQASVPRSQLVSIKYFDLTGNQKRELMNGLSARIIQHEIDHLNGITLLQRMKGKR